MANEPDRTNAIAAEELQPYASFLILQCDDQSNLSLVISLVPEIRHVSGLPIAVY